MLTVDASTTLDFNSKTITTPNAPSLGGALTMAVTKTAPNTFTGSKLTQTAGTLTYGGTLTASLVSGSLATGDQIPLFSAPAYAGALTVSSAPAAPTGLTRSLAQLTGGTGGSITYTCDSTLVANAAADTAICPGGSYSLSGSGSGGSGIYSTFSWASTPAGFTSSSANPSVSPTVPTTYTLTVTDSVGCTASINVVVSIKPDAPTGSASQIFCAGATVADLTATGTSIQWYAASSGGSALSGSTALTNGTHYYASQTVGGLESCARFDVTFTINTPMAGPASYTRNSGSSIKDITVASLLAFASTPQGTNSLSAVGPTSTNGTGVVISGTKVLYKGALPSGGDTFSYVVMNGCGATATNTVTITAATVSGQTNAIVSLTNDVATVTFFGVPGTAYQAQRATNVNFTGTIRSWTTNAPSGGAFGVFQVSDDFSDVGGPPAPSQSYYRLLVP
jgi:hypothetical protein